MEQWIPWIIMAVIALVGGALGHWLARRRAWVVLAIAAAALVGMSARQWLKAQAAPSGWDGIAEALVVYLFLAPMLAGLLAGLVVALVRRRG
jgi:predicted branched-subunit amino acid permease